VVGSEWRREGGSGDAGPSFPFIVGACRCLGWCWAAIAVRHWCMWALIAVRLWLVSLPFVVGTRHCRFSLACIIAVCSWCTSLPWVVLCWCRHLWGVVLLCGGWSCSVCDRHSWVGHCCLWMGVIVVRGVVVVVNGASVWSMGAHRLGWGVIVSVHDRHPSVGGSLSSVLCHHYLLVSQCQWPGLGWEGSPMDDERNLSFVVWFPCRHQRCDTWNVGQ
jgi:hypothetical protein